MSKNLLSNCPNVIIIKILEFCDEHSTHSINLCDKKINKLSINALNSIMMEKIDLLETIGNYWKKFPIGKPLNFR